MGGASGFSWRDRLAEARQSVSSSGKARPDSRQAKRCQPGTEARAIPVEDNDGIRPELQLITQPRCGNRPHDGEVAEWSKALPC
jgi:hypothetical protein